MIVLVRVWSPSPHATEQSPQTPQSLTTQSTLETSVGEGVDGSSVGGEGVDGSSVGGEGVDGSSVGGEGVDGSSVGGEGVDGSSVGGEGVDVSSSGQAPSLQA